jgi:hypothetical protein
MFTKMRTMGGVALVCLLAVAPMVHADIVDVIDYTFDNTESWAGNSVQELKTAGWTVNTPADSNAAFYVSPTETAANSTMNGVLWLKDDVNAATSPLGKPRAELNFGELVNGVLSVRYCGAGSPSYWAQVIILDGANELARVEITDNSNGSVVTGSGTTALGMAVGTGSRARNIEFSWTVNSDGTGSLLTVKRDGTAVVTDVAFQRAGIPDTLGFQVGQATSVGRYLVVDSIHLTSDMIPEPASLALLGLGVLTLVSSRSRRRSS